MRKDHRPYWVKKAYLGFQRFYAKKYLAPHLDALGEGGFFLKPWHVEVFGGPVRMGKHATVIATSDKKVRLSVWPEKAGEGAIDIGDCCLICPGVRISAATRIEIGDNCMLASGAYITDADWHDLYDRSHPVGNTAKVILSDNVWIGDGATVCKGVTIGKNSIVGAGAVVTGDIPPNAVAAGNPAKIVKRLDPSRTFTTRSDWYADPRGLTKGLREWDRALLEGNTLRGWFRSLLFPRKGD